MRRRPDGQIALGDLILAIDGKKVKSVNDLYDIQKKHKIGDTVAVLLLHNGKRREVKITLAAQ